MKKIYLLLTVLMTLVVNQTLAQNPTWSLAPKFYNIYINPLPTSSSGYGNQPAVAASNMQLDSKGNILFFVVDNNIFDKDGESIGSLQDAYQLPQVPDAICPHQMVTSEIAIAQDPGDCNRYYIFTSFLVNLCFPQDGFDLLHRSTPFVSVLDFNVSRPNNANKMGKIVSTEFLEGKGGGNTWYGTDEGCALFSVSKIKTSSSGNYRFLFVSNNYHGSTNGIIRYKIGNAGIVYDGIIPYQDQMAVYYDPRAEMELVELPNGHYRIACPYICSGSHNGKSVKEAIYTAELDGSGNVISGQEKTIYMYSDPIASNPQPHIHGLEFSPNGENLFFTHVVSQYHPNSFDYYNFSTPNTSDPAGNGVYSIYIDNGQNEKKDFQFSQIEYSIDGNLYLGANGRLASFDNPNVPSMGTFSDSSVAVPGYTFNSGSSINNVSDRNKLFPLPDQIDGMNYQQSTTTAFDVNVYSAQTSGTWEQGVGNNPWNLQGNEVFVGSELIIPAGKSITIQNMIFHFAPQAKLIIEQGGKLILDGSTLTNMTSCNNQQDFWQGVEVWGTSNQNQYPTNHPTYQGMLVLTNQSSIENAHVGATNWKVNDWDALGGVIQSYDSKFLNNQRDVAFMTYQNHMPTGMLTGDLSGFTNTDFVSDNNFMEKGLSIEPHISMWQVNNIRFTNCHFANNVTVNKDNSTSPATGIKTINAGFTVRPGCSITLPYGQACPTANLLKSSFSGLKLGIEATSASTSQTVTIEQTDFLDNYFGIAISEINGVSINRNHIELGTAGYADVTSPGFGILVTNSTGYLVEENTITTNLSPNNFNGIYIYNSGPDDNRVYKNTVSNMVGGVLGTGVNHNSNYQQGLQFLCNTLQKNNSGIFIGATPVTHGIRFYQGNNATSTSPKLAAGNTFLSNATDIINYANSIVYFYNSSTMSQPTFTPPNYITMDPNAVTRSCPSSFDGTIFLPFARSSMIDSLSGKMGTQKTAYDNLDFTLQSLIDNGNTEQFKDSIVYDWSDDAWKLRAKLLAASPYVSAAALLQTAEQSVLPDGMLLEVLLVNPDATRGEDFINELKIAAPGFPDYMLDFVRDNRDATTLRTNMESQLSILHTDLTQTRDILRYLRKNQDEYTYADRLNTVQMGNEIYHKAELMDFYIENQEFAKADSVLNEIAMANEYAGDLPLIDNYDDYLNFRAGLGTRTIAQLDSSEIAQLEILAAGDNRVAEYAQNILCFFYHICYDQMPDLNVPQAKSMSGKQSGSEVNKNDLFYHIKVYPNPAVDYCSIGWEIYDELNDAYYSIHDINGQEVMRGEITGNKNEKVIDTRELRNGIYVIGIYNQNQLKVNKKLVVNR